MAAAAFGGAGADDDEGVDLSKPLLLSAYGEWTKKSGYYTLAPGAKPAPLIYDDEDDRPGAMKAEKADRVIFTRQTFSESPGLLDDEHVVRVADEGDRRQSVHRRVRVGPSKVLVDFKNCKGQRLQGTLTLPANYQPGKKYPMLVYFYELLSNTHHQFPMPRVRRPAAFRRVRERRLSRLPAGHRLRDGQARQLGARLRDERREEGHRDGLCRSAGRDFGTRRTGP